MSLFADFDRDPAVRHAPLDVHVRPAVPNDADEIARLYVARNGGDVDDTLAHVQADLNSEHPERERRHLFVVDGDDGLAGYGRVRFLERAADAPQNAIPAGWYLTGVTVDPEWRRRGIGRALTQARIDWVAERADRVLYVASAQNRTSIALHEALGFTETARGIHAPGVSFTGGVGVLFARDV